MFIPQRNARPIAAPRCDRLTPFLAALGLGCALLAAGAHAESPADRSAAVVPVSLNAAEPVATGATPGFSELRTRLEGGAGLVVAGEKLHGALLRPFYAMNNYELVWPTRSAQANALLGAVMRAGEHGLDPGLFHAAALRNVAGLAPVERDLLLSDAFLAYGDALARGAVPIEMRMDDEDLTPGPVDVAGTLAQAIAGPDPVASIEALAPHTPAYTALQRALHAETAATADPNRDTRLRKIIVSLERQRWLPRQLPAQRIWVNISNANLVLYQGDKPVFNTRVIVGETDKQTPEMQTMVDGVLFNPPWNVPYSIVTKEILPKLSADPNYLARHHMVRRPNGGLQQEAGPHSALGRIKFEMANRFDVYLHDTPSKNLFARDNRRQSHGCVRVQNPRELAALVLNEPMTAVEKAIALNYTNRRQLPAPVPAFFVYETAFVEANGSVAFGPDVYNRDAEIWQKLQRASHAPMAQSHPTQRQG